ncbi:MAG TPA: ABC transporter permease [bacterium]|jgi:lipopolysaccharide transport system permease protein
MFVALAQRLGRSRELIGALVYRELAVRYRQSVLGLLWAVVQPVLLMVVFTAIQQVVAFRSGGTPYPVFAYAGLLPWTTFSNAVLFAGRSVVGNASIVRKIYFPWEILPTASVIVALVDFVLAFAVLLILLGYYGLPFHPTLLAIPVLLLVQTTLALGVGYATAALGVFRRDALLAIPFVMQIWMFASPVIYSAGAVPARLRGLFLLNPMAGVIEGYRAAILDGRWPSPELLGVSALVSGAVLLLGYAVFRRLEPLFADVI